MGKKKKTPIKRPLVAGAASDTSLDAYTEADLNNNPPLREEIVRGDLAATVSNPDQETPKESIRTEADVAGHVGGSDAAPAVIGITSAVANGDASPLRTGEQPSDERDCELSRNAQTTSKSTPTPLHHVASNTEQGKMPSAPAMSWVDCVTGKSRSLQKKGEKFLADSGRACVKIPNAVIARNKKAWASFVLGQFHGNLPSLGALHAILNGIWSNKNKDISISRTGTQSVLIKIPNPATRKRVLEQGVWHIEGQTMFVGAWEPGLQAEVPELKQIPVWVDFKGVPPHFYSAEGMEYIAGLVGQPLHLHPRTAAMINLEVARVFTLVDLMEDLPEEVEVMFESGETHTIEVSCPWLPPKCTHCDLFGHSLRRCPTAPIKCLKCRSPTHEASECNRNRSNTGNQQRKQGSASQVWKPVRNSSTITSAPLTSAGSEPSSAPAPQLPPVTQVLTSNEVTESTLLVTENANAQPSLPDTLLEDEQHDASLHPQEQSNDPEHVDQSTLKTTNLPSVTEPDHKLAALSAPVPKKPEVMGTTRKSARVDEQGKIKNQRTDKSATGNESCDEAGDAQTGSTLDKLLKPGRSNAVKAKGRGLLANPSS